MTLHGIKVLAFVLWLSVLPVVIVKWLLDPWVSNAAAVAIRKAFNINVPQPYPTTIYSNFHISQGGTPNIVTGAITAEQIKRGTING